MMNDDSKILNNNKILKQRIFKENQTLMFLCASNPVVKRCNTKPTFEQKGHMDTNDPHNSLYVREQSFSLPILPISLSPQWLYVYLGQKYSQPILFALHNLYNRQIYEQNVNTLINKKMKK